MKRIWIVLLAALFIGLCAFLWEIGPGLLFGFMLASTGSCDEGPVTDWGSANERGDVVEEYIKACTGFGTVVDYSIVLQLSGDEKMTTLIEHERLYYGFPKFRWLDDDRLNIDLGKVEWISKKVDRVGSIKITYSYTKASWW